MECIGAHTRIFPETFKLFKHHSRLSSGTASVERSLSSTKLIQIRLRNRISDQNLGCLMRISIKGPELTAVNFYEVLNLF